MKSLLTVAIPTYNRPESLSHTLDVLSSSASDQFEVLICDDSSDNRVQDLVARYQQQFSNIRYVRNTVNLGFSANVAQLYELSVTPYVWFLCDDDTIFKDSVSKIISTLEKYQPTVSIFNCSWVNSYGIESLAGVKEDRLHNSFDRFDSYDVLMRMTFLSILVFQKRQGVNEILIKSNNFQDNVFVQLSLGLLLLSENFKLCESAEYILHRNVGYRYGEFYKFILLDPLKAVFQLPTRFDNKKFIVWAIRALPTNMLLFLSQKIGLFQYVGKPSRQSKVLLKRYYGKLSIVIRLTRVLLNLVPSSLVHIAFFLQVCSFHGLSNGPRIYKKLCNRAFKDRRDTAFTSYL